MNKPLSTEELNRLKTDFPVMEPKPEVWDRARKLEHLAHIVETSSHRDLGMFHRLESWSKEMLYAMSPDAHNSFAYGPTVFDLARKDLTFQRLGLSNTAYLGTILDFMELTQRDAHTFSCDCGGSISKANAAKHIRWLATGATRTSRIMNYLGKQLAERFLPSALPTVG